MNKIYVADIKDRDPVESVFLVKDKITAMAKNGKPYLNLRLMDRTGEVDGKVWDNVDQLAAQFERDDFIAVRAKASIYLGRMQLVIADLRRIPDEAVDLAHFLPRSERDPQEMEQELAAAVASVGDRHLRGLLEAFFGDPAFLAGYRNAPAAKGMHHVCIGGLLEHSLAVVRLVDRVAPLYPDLNRDLLVAGALLHDAGKVREMAFQRAFDYTDEGKLIGHISIGVEMIQERLAGLPDFPPELAMLLKHMILSHHGQYEFGSPKRPKTLEAIVLNFLDDLDAKINGVRSHIARETPLNASWTSYHRLYDRYFYAERYAGEEGPEESVAPTAEVAPPAPDREGERPRKNFSNNPFEQLKGENLKLF